MEHWFHPLIVWLHFHPTAAGFVTFLVTFVESLAIIGLFIPGSVTLSAIGGLVGSGVVPAMPIFLWAIFGAVLGDGLSFWIGYRYHARLKNMWPFCRFPKLIERGERFFQQHGGKGIFISRFIGPMRPVMPLIAGMMRVNPLKFMLVEMLSGILWAPAYMLPGILVGAAAAHFAPHHVFHYLLILLCVIFAILILVKFVMSIANTIINSWCGLIDLTWKKLKNRRSWLYHSLVEQHHIQSTRPLHLAIFSVLFFILYILLFNIVRVQPSWLYHFNLDILSFFSSLNVNWGRTVAITISNYLGFSVAILFGTACIALYFSYKRDWHALRHFLGLIIATFIVTILSKYLSDSVRPQTILQQEPTLSFPSTHTVLALVFWGYVAFFISHQRPVWVKKLSYSIAGVFTFAVSLSQLYLNAHWFTDAIGALLLGSFLLTVAAITFNRRETLDRFSPLFLGVISVLSVALAATLFQLKYYPQQFTNYHPAYQITYINEQEWWHSPTSILPIYRNNRFNQPVAVLNLQWLSDLNTIEDELGQHGWVRPLSLEQGLKQQLMGNDSLLVFPIPNQFANHNPVLTLIKPLPEPGVYLLLELWDNYYFTDQAKIYVGSISYHFPVKQWLAEHHQEVCANNYPAALAQLNSILTDWQTRIITFTPEHTLKHNSCVDYKDEVLLLREKSG